MSETTEAAAPEAGTAEDEARAVAAAETVDDNAPQDEAPADDAGDDEAEQPEAPEIEEIELAFGAKTLKVAKGSIPDDVLAELDQFTKGVQGDYTRKTQELAEQRRAEAAKGELFEKLAGLKGEALKAFSKGQMLADEIQRLEQIDVGQVWQSNPDQARQISDQLASKRAEFERTVQAVAQHEHAMTAEQERASATLMDAGRAEMQRAVKGFDEKAEAALVEYAVKQYGIPEQDARKWPLNPKTAQMAWKAMQFDRMQASTAKATAPKPPAAPSAPVKAIRTVAGGGGSRDLAQLAATDMEAYARERARQESAARKR